MAEYHGFQAVDITSYATFKSQVNGNGYDIDGYYGAQCWDGVDLLWRNLPDNPRTFKLGPQGWAYEAWAIPSSRIDNAGNEFDLIYSIDDVIQGDVLVFGIGGWVGEAGHVAFADEDYQGGNYINCLGQNQGGGIPFSTGGACFNVQNLYFTNFLGAFRYKAWQSTPPTPPTPDQKHKKSNYYIKGRYYYMQY